MGDGEDRDVAAGEPDAEVGYEFVAQGGVEAGEGFVEQKKVTGGNGERAGESDALAFAAGELGGHLRDEVLDAAEGQQGS